MFFPLVTGYQLPVYKHKHVARLSIKTGGLALSKEKNLSPGGGCSNRLQKNSVFRILADPHFPFNTIHAPTSANRQVLKLII